MCTPWPQLDPVVTPIVARGTCMNEFIVVHSAEHAYFYAKYVLNAPFPAGEAVIVTDAYYAHLYAKNVLKGPFPLGEQNMLNSTLSDYYQSLCKEHE